MYSKTNSLGSKKEIINEEFWLSSWNTVVVKVGSNILAWDSEWVNIENMQNIIDWIDYLMQIWLNVILVSSWAVAVWRYISEKEWKNYWNSLEDKSYLSSIWQARLIEIYRTLVKSKENIKWILQGLLINNIFDKKEEEATILWNLNRAFNDRYLAILNENDFATLEELKFSDNDELAWLIAKAIKAKVLVLISNIDWIYKNYWEKNQELIEKVDNIDEVRQYCEDTKSSVWTGWMKSKLDVMEKMQNSWITWILTNWAEKNILQKIFEWKVCNKTIFRV